MQKPVPSKQIPPTLDAVQLLWGVFRSPAFFVTVGLLAIFWIFLGTQIPQEQSLAELGKKGSFRWVQLVTSFGLNQVFSSWVLGGLGILAALSAIAMVIHARAGSPKTGGEWRTGNRWPRETFTSDADKMPLLKELIERELRLGTLRQKGEEWRLERGLFLESLMVMALGIATVGITAFLFLTQSVSGRVEIVPDEQLRFEESMIMTSMLKEGQWEKANLPLFVACNEGKREDPLHTRTCRVETPRGEVEGEIAIGRPFVSSGLAIRLEKLERDQSEVVRTFVRSNEIGETTWSYHKENALLDVNIAGTKDDSPLLLRARDTKNPGWLQAGKGGPLWVLEGAQRPSNQPADVGVESGEVLTLAFHETRYRVWFIWGFALFFVGILACWLMPHFAVKVRLDGDALCRVDIVSLNRPRRPAQLMSTLKEKLKAREDEGGGDA